MLTKQFVFAEQFMLKMDSTEHANEPLAYIM
jgi:hypothetical protein